MGKQWKQWDTIFLGSKITADDDCSHEIKRCLLLGRKSMTNLDSILKNRDITLPTKVRLVKAMVFPVVMYGWMWELDYKESWVPKSWRFWTVVLEKTLESPLDCKEIKPVSPKGNQSWIFVGRTDAETPILWPLDAKNCLLGKDPNGRRRRGWQRMRWLNGSLIQWRWVWVGSGSWWWTERPGMLWSMGLWRVGYDWMTELNWKSWPLQFWQALVILCCFTTSFLFGGGVFYSCFNERVGLPRWHSGKESTCQWRRCGFDFWTGKIPCRRKWQPTPVFLLGNPMHRGA